LHFALERNEAKRSRHSTDQHRGAPAFVPADIKKNMCTAKTDPPRQAELERLRRELLRRITANEARRRERGSSAK